MAGLSAKRNQIDLMYLKKLLEAGKVKPAIDKQYPLNETAEALRNLDEGPVGGETVIVLA